MNILEFQQLFKRYDRQCDELGVLPEGRHDIHSFLARCVEQPEFVTEIQQGLPEDQEHKRPGVNCPGFPHIGSQPCEYCDDETDLALAEFDREQTL